MRILITGGAGFIGSHLADRLISEGNEVYIIDNLSTGKFDNIQHLEYNPKFHYIIDSILNYKVLEDLISKVDLIYHMAAAVGVKYIVDNPLSSIMVNIRGTEYVLELANKYKKKVLVASTSEIYGKSDKVPFKEDDDRVLGSTCIARWGYSSSKAVDEFLALAYYREKQLPITIVRCFNTIGPRQTGQYGMVVPRFVKNALLGHPISVYGDGSQSRCFSYISDIVDGMIGLMNSKKCEGQIFNIGNDEEISIEDLASRIKEKTNSTSKIIKVPYEDAYEEGFEDMKRRVPDISKINQYIGFKPKVSLNEMLDNIIHHFKS